MPEGLPETDLPELALVAREYVEQRLGRSYDSVKAEVSESEAPDQGLVKIVREFDELVNAEAAVLLRSDDLLDQLSNSPDELRYEQVEAAQAVSNALTYRDARVATLQHVLDQHAPVQLETAATRARSHTAAATRSTTTAASTTPPTGPATSASAARHR